MSVIKRILAPDGTVTDREALLATGLTGQDCLALYRRMVFVSLFTEKATNEGKNKYMPLYISPRGQEAAEVGSAYALKATDAVFWYTRSQGPAFARGYSAEAMFKLFAGVPDKEVAKEFYNRYLAAPYVLVGVHLTHATGYAMGEKLKGTSNLAVAYFGDGATAQGDFHEALNWASVHSLPVIFICENNRIAISTPNRLESATETFAEKAVAYGMESDLVDGNDAFAVYAAVKRAALRARDTYSERRPTLIEAVTRRMHPHTTAIGVAKELTPDEEELMEREDPIPRLRKFLLSPLAVELLGVEWSEEEDARLREEYSESIQKAAEAVRKMRPENFDGKAIIEESVRLHEGPDVSKKHAGISREEFEEKVLRGTPEVIPGANFVTALNFAHHDAMRLDDRVITIGEDVGEIGSVFRTVALPEKFVAEHMPLMKDRVLSRYLPHINIFGPERCLDSPLDEDGLVGNAVGLSLAGIRPIVEIQFSGFVFEAINQIVSEFAQLRHITGGIFPLPAVIRLPYGGGPFIQHHREFEGAFFMNAPGLRIAVPRTPQDAYDMFMAAVASENPVIFFEDKNLYRRDDIVQDLIRRPFQKPIEEFGVAVAREADPGAERKITITAYGRLVYDALKAAEELQQEGISAEVLDLRVFAPLDKATIVSSVHKTGRLLVVQEEPVFGGTGGEIAAIVTESPESFHYLQAPVKRLGPPRTYFPPVLVWKDYLPSVEDIVREAKAAVSS